jgi:hypothetical protein
MLGSLCAAELLAGAATGGATAAVSATAVAVIGGLLLAIACTSMLPPALISICHVTAFCVAAVFFVAELLRVSLLTTELRKSLDIFFYGNICNVGAGAMTGNSGLDGKTPSVRPIERCCRALLSALAGRGPAGLAGLGKNSADLSCIAVWHKSLQNGSDLS